VNYSQDVASVTIETPRWPDRFSRKTLSARAVCDMRCVRVFAVRSATTAFRIRRSWYIIDAYTAGNAVKRRERRFRSTVATTTIEFRTRANETRIPEKKRRKKPTTKDPLVTESITRIARVCWTWIVNVLTSDMMMPVT